MRVIDEELYRLLKKLQLRMERLERDDRPKTLNGSKTHNWASLAAGSQQSTPVTVTGAAVGDFVLPPAMSVSVLGTQLFGVVTAADTVTVYQYNGTGSAQDVAEGTLYVRVLKR